MNKKVVYVGKSVVIGNNCVIKSYTRVAPRQARPLGRFYMLSEYKGFYITMTVLAVVIVKLGMLFV
jgi:UDP-3-O-[3-hydroxymyristoyl] glucosamine N-acyltransferase